MKIGIIGGGDLSSTLSWHLTRAGYGPNVMCEGEYVEAIILDCPVVFFAQHGDALEKSIKRLSGAVAHHQALWISVGLTGTPIDEVMKDPVSGTVCLRFDPANRQGKIDIIGESVVVNVLHQPHPHLLEWLLCFLKDRNCEIDVRDPQENPVV